MKNKHAQTITKSFSQIIKTSNRKPCLLETDDEKGYVNKIFNDFLEQNNVERYYRHSDQGAIFAERFNRAIRNLLRNQSFQGVRLTGKRNYLLSGFGDKIT